MQGSTCDQPNKAGINDKREKIMKITSIKWGAFAALLFNATPVTTWADDAMQPASEEAPIQVMVLGTFHFANPGKDLVNTKSVDVLLPERQRELKAISDSLMAFKPTMVAVEQRSDAPDFVSKGYEGFTPEMLASKRNETIQLGYRVARASGLDMVYAVDEQPEGDEPDYFPFGKFQEHLEKTSQTDRFGIFFKDFQKTLEEESTHFYSITLPEALIDLNDGKGKYEDPAFYFELMKYDRGEEQPGAELYAYYMMRNTKIFSKLMSVAKPGDRVVLVYGAGHNYWLKQLIDVAPGFEVVDAVPYLEKATATLKN